MSTRTAAGTSFLKVAVIGVACKDHISHTVVDAVVKVRVNIVDELVDSVSSGLSGRGLLGADGYESDDKFVVNRTSVPQEGANNNMYAFYVGCVKWRSKIGRSRLMGLGAVGDGGMLLRG